MSFEELCRVNGIELSEGELDRFSVYRELLKRWGRSINLTSLLSDQDIDTRHFLDSLLGLKAFETFGFNPRGKRFADVGSGAGFPGVPLSIVLEDSHFDLIESRRKRCVFLEQVRRELKLENVDVICGRVEDVERGYDMLLMRAVKSPDEAVEIVSHLIGMGALLCIYRGKEEFRGNLDGFSFREIEVDVHGLNVKRRFLFIWR